mgnify:CR=1 FL=1
MTIHTTEIRVRYAETDQMGVVYHGNYAQYFEVSRVEWLRSLGVSYKEMEEQGVALPVVNLNVNFKKPAIYDELLFVKTKLREKPGVKIILDQEIYNENQDLLTTAEIVLVFVNTATKRSMQCPDYLLEKLGCLTL